MISLLQYRILSEQPDKPGCYNIAQVNYRLILSVLHSKPEWTLCLFFFKPLVFIGYSGYFDCFCGDSSRIFDFDLGGCCGSRIRCYQFKAGLTLLSVSAKFKS